MRRYKGGLILQTAMKLTGETEFMTGKNAAPRQRAEIRSEYFRYLVPTIIGQVAHCCYCLADVFFVGLGVGKDGLAALNVALPIFTVYTTFSIMSAWALRQRSPYAGAAARMRMSTAYLRWRL